MDSRELAELQRLMKKASDAGLMDGKLAMKSGKIQASASSGAMTDASKRRLVDDDWSKVDPEPEVQKAAEDDLKSMEKNLVPKDVWASIYSDLDDSVAVPEEFRDVHQWGRVRIDMDKYADLGICFEKAVAMAKSGDSDMNRYLNFIKNKYGKTTGDKQAWGLARYLLKIKFDGARKGGYNRVLVRLAQAIFYLRVLPEAICMYCCKVKQRISLVSDSVWVTPVVLTRFGFPLNLT